MSEQKESDVTKRHIYADNPGYGEFPDQTQFSRRVRREMRKESVAMIGGIADMVAMDGGGHD